MLDKLEKKFGKYAITNFSYYIMFVYIIGAVLGMISPFIYTTYLALDFDAISRGQVWRLITFIFYPYIESISFLNILFGAISIYMYYFIGTTLENTWGAFRFNVYYISGFLLNILATLFIYLIFGQSISFGMTYIQNALFLAFATVMPDVQFRLYFVLPVKVKWLGYLYGGLLVFQIITNFLTFTPGGIAMAVAILISILNFVIYFVGKKNSARPSKRTREFNKKIKKNEKKMNYQKELPAHTCCVCGKTSVSHPEYQFRYCSKCDGLYEFCQDHIFAHEHIKGK